VGTNLNTVIAFIIIFGALVFFHELGHLVMAKRAGMLCREFAIGFGPKVFSFYKNETLYTIRLLPLGGFVRVAGEDPEVVEIKPGYTIGLSLNSSGVVKKIVVNNKSKHRDLKIIEVEKADLVHSLTITGYENEGEQLQTFSVDEKAIMVVDEKPVQIAPYNRQFASKTLGQRAVQIFAGPFMNFVLAFFIFIVIGLLQGTPINDPVLGQITEGSAKNADLQEGDKVLAIDGKEMTSWDDVVKVIQVNPDKELIFTIERNDQISKVSVIPEARENGEEKIGLIGVYKPVEKSPLKSISYAASQTYLWTKQIIFGLGKLITGQFSIDMLSGPVGIYSLTDQVAQSGLFNLMRWASILSINLGIINLLPLPALDGGRLLFLGIEGIRGKPIDPQKEGLVHFIGFAFLMLLMLVVTWNDIQTFFL
jgi:regulator of sigma E protease